MPAPTLSDGAAELYAMLEPLAYADEENGWALAHFCQALSLQLDDIEAIVRDDGDRPGWADMLDATAAPAAWLPWLAQLVGVTVPTGASEADARAAIQSPEGFSRGTPASIVKAAQKYLTGSKIVYLRERDDGAYHFTVSTRTSETPDSDAVLAELLKVKPIGLVMDYQVIAGQDFTQLDADHADFDAVEAAYADFDAVNLDLE